MKTKITVKPDCENSPKKIILRDLNIAFLEQDIETIKQTVTEDIVWNMVGDSVLTGLDNLLQSIEEMKDVMAAFIIDNIITHGDVAALNGTMTMEDEIKYSFCDVYMFDGFGPKAKVKEMTSYIIKI